jgi:hypothetical protein
MERKTKEQRRKKKYLMRACVPFFAMKARTSDVRMLKTNSKRR